MTFQIRYNRTTNHIAGIEARTPSTGLSLNYADTACPVLTRNKHRMALGQQYEDLADALNAIRNHYSRKPCTKCLQAAEAALTR